MEFVQLHFQLLTSIGLRYQLKSIPQISSLSEAIVTHLLYKYSVSSPINPNMLSLCAFLNITENIKTMKLALLLWSIVQTLQLNDDRKSKGKESYTASALIYTYIFSSCMIALKRPSGSSVKQLLASPLQKQETNHVRLCSALTYKDQTGKRDLYIIYTCTYNIQGAWPCRASVNQKPDCNSVMPFDIIIFYIPANIRDYYHVLRTGEGAMDCTCSWSLDWKEPVSQATSCSAS